MWNWVDVGCFIPLISAFILRVFSLTIISHDDMAYYSNISFDVLSFAAIPLWFRVLLLFDHYAFFGSMMIIIRSMIADAAMFFVFLSIVFVGTFHYSGNYRVLTGINRSINETKGIRCLVCAYRRISIVRSP
jgi:hypothetical protein